MLCKFEIMPYLKLLLCFSLSGTGPGCTGRRGLRIVYQIHFLLIFFFFFFFFTIWNWIWRPFVKREYFSLQSHFLSTRVACV
ncbi:hypothetical protein VNO77_28242 [Canavalia gladiata]|uniref:Uncharacterized protein n=1 Tax=Canavalia gladiata TaxID=3824 RepID=A0AAN9KVA5_CANGL